MSECSIHHSMDWWKHNSITGHAIPSVPMSTVKDINLHKISCKALFINSYLPRRFIVLFGYAISINSWKGISWTNIWCPIYQLNGDATNTYIYWLVRHPAQDWHWVGGCGVMDMSVDVRVQRYTERLDRKPTVYCHWRRRAHWSPGKLLIAICS